MIPRKLIAISDRIALKRQIKTEQEVKMKQTRNILHLLPRTTQSIMILGLMTCLAWGQVAAANPDPLPAHSVPRGKDLRLEILKEILGQAIDTGSAYYFDYSNASFQIEDHYWSEGLGIRYRDFVSQRYRSIDFISPSRRTYQTELLEVFESGEIKRFAINRAAFSDWEEASRHWKTYRSENGKLVLERSWHMRYELRVRNTYYKPAAFASKQMRDSLTTAVHLNLQGLPYLTVDGNDWQSTSNPTRTVSFSTSKNGVSSSYTIPTNYRISSEQVDELYCPGR